MTFVGGDGPSNHQLNKRGKQFFIGVPLHIYSPFGYQMSFLWVLLMIQGLVRWPV